MGAALGLIRITMLTGLLTAAVLGHSYHTAEYNKPAGSDGEVVFNSNPDTGRIVFLGPGEVIKVNVTGVDSIVATPAFRDASHFDGYSITCESGQVTTPQPHETNELEPYFQVPIRMPWPKEAVSSLQCTRHVEITVTETALVFIGTVDRWTFEDLMARGVAIFDLHDRWNDALFTYPLSLAAAGLVVATSFWLSSMCDGPVVAFESQARYFLYVGAIAAFAAAAAEGIIHCGIAQLRLPGRATEKLAEGLAVVILPNAAAIAIIVVIMYVPWSRNWAVLELITAFSMFIFFYAGLYVGPSLWCAAALVRLADL